MTKKLHDAVHVNNGHEEEQPEIEPKFSDLKERALKAYRAKDCSITAACDAIGISRMSFHNWMNRDPDFKEAVKMIDEEDLDFAEGQLRTLMKGQFVYRKKKDKHGKDIDGQFELDAEGNPIRDWITPIDNASVIFKLKTKGKNRGYTYRTELTGAEGNAIGGFEINIVRKKKDEQNPS